MITISLCMIVKNEEAVLSRILESMKTIADEIIIVDTGSADLTKEEARQYTSLIFDFPWTEDFSAARNYACSKATKDYWMWLDADDMISVSNQHKLMELKDTLDPSVDMVFMKYVSGFDENGRPSIIYSRERLVKSKLGYQWKGRVHEAISPHGKLLYSDIEIEHRKLCAGDPDRNINIYENMLQMGETLEPRHQFYYGRELFYHRRYQEAVQVLLHFLKEPDGWEENKIDACLQLSHCYEKLGKDRKGLTVLFYSFHYDVPRAEVCCEIGRLLMKSHSYNQAIHWFQEALAAPLNEYSGAFIQKDCHDYIPYIQLCVCYDRLGEYDKAYEFHKRSMSVKPEAEAVKFNQDYFQGIIGSFPLTT